MYVDTVPPTTTHPLPTLYSTSSGSYVAPKSPSRLYSGRPAIFRLATSEEIIGVAMLEHNNMWGWHYKITRPLRVVSAISATNDEVSIRFVRWIPLSEATVYSINAEQVITVTRLSPVLIPEYQKQAKKFYSESLVP